HPLPTSPEVGGGVFLTRRRRHFPPPTSGEHHRLQAPPPTLGEVGGGATEDSHLQNSIPFCAFTPSRKGCFTISISVTRSASATISSLALRPVRQTWRSGRLAFRAATTSATAR